MTKREHRFRDYSEPHPAAGQFDRLFDRETGCEYWIRTVEADGGPFTILIEAQPGRSVRIIIEDPPTRFRETAHDNGCALNDITRADGDLVELQFNRDIRTPQQGVQLLGSVLEDELSADHNPTVNNT